MKDVAQARTDGQTIHDPCRFPPDVREGQMTSKEGYEGFY